MVGGYQATKLSTISRDAVPVRELLERVAELVALQPRLPILPKDPSTDALLELLRLNSNQTLVLNPRIKLVNDPLKVLQVSGSLSEFRDSDAVLEAV